jgi:hypothetical protein
VILSDYDARESMRALAEVLRETVPAGYTGKVCVTVHFHAGRPASLTVGMEEHAKL